MPNSASSSIESPQKKSGRGTPALSYSFLTPAYDFVMARIAREYAFKTRLVEQMKLQEGFRVLDLGCGTATLTIMIKKACPDMTVVGLDFDLKILAIGCAKIKRSGLDISLNCGTAVELPYPNGCFNRVVSSMMLHHLNRAEKIRALKEVFRVLKPGGELHIADFGKPKSILMRLPSIAIKYFEKASDNIEGLIPMILGHAGFGQVKETTQFATIFGPVSLYKAHKG